MKNAILSDTELTAYSGEHLLYELQFFWVTAKELGRISQPSPMASVLLESFCIHLRNLIEFFYTPAGEERADDVVAPDFCPSWNESISPSLESARERANKEVGHLTLKRKSGSDPTKPWEVSKLFREISDVAKRFAAQASPKKLSPEVGNFLNLAYGKPFTLAVYLNITTSNTTATII